MPQEQELPYVVLQERLANNAELSKVSQSYQARIDTLQSEHTAKILELTSQQQARFEKQDKEHKDEVKELQAKILELTKEHKEEVEKLQAEIKQLLKDKQGEINKATEEVRADYRPQLEQSNSQINSLLEASQSANQEILNLSNKLAENRAFLKEIYQACGINFT